MTESQGVTSRLCPQCGLSVAMDRRHVGAAAPCPGCGTILEAGPGEQAVPLTVMARIRGQLDPVAGWGISVAVHLVLMLIFMYVTWVVGYGQGVQDAEVGIVDDSSGATIEKGSASLSAAEVAMPMVASLAVDAAISSAPIENVAAVSDVGVAVAPTKMEAVIGISGGGAVKGDWTGVTLGGGGGGGGGGQFFGIEARGSKFVYVLDRSGSMVSSKIEALKAELARSVTALKSNSKFYFIFYNERFEAMPVPGLVPATSENKRTHLAWADTMTPDDGTDPTEAMKHALLLKPDAIWLLSDGLFPDRVADAVKAANPGAKIQIHTIAFFENSGEDVLKRIAEENRGKYRFIPPGAIGAPAGAGRGRP